MKALVIIKPIPLELAVSGAGDLRKTCLILRPGKVGVVAIVQLSFMVNDSEEIIFIQDVGSGMSKERELRDTVSEPLYSEGFPLSSFSASFM